MNNKDFIYEENIENIPQEELMALENLLNEVEQIEPYKDFEDDMLNFVHKAINDELDENTILSENIRIEKDINIEREIKNAKRSAKQVKKVKRFAYLMMSLAAAIIMVIYVPKYLPNYTAHKQEMDQIEKCAPAEGCSTGTDGDVMKGEESSDYAGLDENTGDVNEAEGKAVMYNTRLHANCVEKASEYEAEAEEACPPENSEVEDVEVYKYKDDEDSDDAAFDMAKDKGDVDAAFETVKDESDADSELEMAKDEDSYCEAKEGIQLEDESEENKSELNEEILKQVIIYVLYIIAY